MLTKNEITSLNLSPTKKDFVQIWNELLEVAGRLSERWDPTSTNESDPGIVILKALTGIADKLNYNIDKNTLEAFMPTAAQEDSMRKLCEMLGYNIKYYRSAETIAKIKYHNTDPSDDEVAALKNDKLYIPKFTVLTNSDKDISYFTVDSVEYPAPAHISDIMPYATVKCMEGQIVQCESLNENNTITSSQIADNGRFYMPEYQIAENGIFVYNMAPDGSDGYPWKKVDNLNIQARGSRVFKFGYDSYEGRPYIEFPEDYSELINDGLFIYYTRTSGASGNISFKTLTQIELPTDGDWSKVSAESFSVENDFSTTTGSNIESIGQAYNNFKKTIGTFETLVTCRDYMNKIYKMTSTSTGKPYVSNVLATDIRTDLNRAITICSCDDAGIFYKDTALYDTISLSETTKPVFNANTKNWCLGSVSGPTLSKFIYDDTDFNYSEDGTASVKNDFWTIKQDNTVFKTALPAAASKSAIDHFDLVLYPFKSYSQIKGNVRDIQGFYDDSFKMVDKSNFKLITDLLDGSEIKTIAHNIKAPIEGDLLSINNYLRLNAVIGTNSKITSEEGILLKEIIKIALANAFNMRELDFGEEIPFESIVDVIQNADPRIKVVSLEEPALYTTFSVLDRYSSGTPQIYEYAVASDWLTQEYAEKSGRFEYKSEGAVTFDTKTARKIYNRLAVRNILAGRTPLFKYHTEFTPSFSEGAYKTTETITLNMLPSQLLAQAEPAAQVWSVRASGSTPILAKDFTPSRENPCIVKYDKDSNATYTSQWLPISANELNLAIDDLAIKKSLKAVDVDNKGPITEVYNGIIYVSQWDDLLNRKVFNKVMCTRTAIPKDTEDASYPADGIITKTAKDITKIKATCKIHADAGNISNVTLADNEFIKFRAPNFITDKTFPAYVNYHLDLGNNFETEGHAATAHTLAKLLNDGDITVRNRRRQAVLDYFKNCFDPDGKSLKKTFTLTQKITKTGEVASKPDISIDNPTSIEETFNINQILFDSGFVKLVSKKATLAWAPQGGESPSGDGPAISIDDLPLEDSFIVSPDVLSSSELYPGSIPNTVNKLLAEIPVEDLPKDCDWTISYQFEYVPFDVSTIRSWGNFVIDKCNDIFGFAPIEEHGTMLWRAYGNDYEIGKYILTNHSKLLPLTSNHIGLTDRTEKSSRLYEVYIIEYLGKDTVANFIRNEEEYMLRAGEKLYIEYTPSSTAENGTDQESVKEVYGAGTIIKPKGFENGLISSYAYEQMGHTAPKEVTFDIDSGSDTVSLFSLGANEQIEIRELAKVTLDSESLSDLYIYKNFNNCPALEDRPLYQNGKRIGNSYTLKDGEYIFYTDKNKSELAYFGAGTEVTLAGGVQLQKYKVIDIADIFNDGIESIPWQPIYFDKNDSISFQEFQYIALGSGDKINSLVIDSNVQLLDSTWQTCYELSYTLAGTTGATKLPKIDIYDNTSESTGWAVCSLLELNVSPAKAQSLRSTEQVETSIELIDSVNNRVATVSAKDAQHPIAFKTNLTCQASTGSIEISDIYLNPDNIKSFDVKIFAEDTPSIIQTQPKSLAPYQDLEDLIAELSAIPDPEQEEGEEVDSKIDVETQPVDITKWTNKSQLIIDTVGTSWHPVALSNLSSLDTGDKYDNALKLSAVITPKTYGIFSIYLQYGDESKNPHTWIETLPGTEESDVTLFNNLEIIREGNRLYLNPGINCIRINKTNDLFIKTTAADGAMYFDSVRLVDCSTITVNNKDTQTLGLNMTQIGYLDTEDNRNIIELERCLLSEIRALDKNRDFYYTVPIDTNIAIDFNEGDEALNTLMNPAVNYDINNINNNFVISKIDINYLTKGIQIARSSRLN